MEASSLAASPFLARLFTPPADTAEASDYLIGLLTDMSAANADMPDGGVESEFIFRYYSTVNRMKELMRESVTEMSVDTYFRLLERMTDIVSIPFSGEPLAGLQIMGVLETRALDFDRIIILSMNEGVFPARRTANSFIPYTLRQGFGLPAYEHADSVRAYNFYRLIYRASKVSLIYDSRTGGQHTGEVSRFVHQLRYHYEYPLHTKLAVYEVSSSKAENLAVEKSADILRKLDAYRPDGGKALSASAVNTWLDCPLKFYLSYIEGVKEDEEVSETVESNVFGSIIHKVMEVLYSPLCGKTVTADILKKMRADEQLMTHIIEQAFAEHFFKTGKPRQLTGQNYLIGEMIRKYAVKILEQDGRLLTPFTYILSEKEMETGFRLSDGSDVSIKGFIDRIDRVGDTVRIIDYKSGLGTSVFTSVDSLFDSLPAERPKAVMQVFLYAMLYGRLPDVTGMTIQPGIYYLRSLFNADFDPAVYLSAVRGRCEAVTDFAVYADEYEAALRNCLDLIFSPDIAFTQTANGKACTYCPFKAVCGR
jgi:hypothetical protein